MPYRRHNEQCILCNQTFSTREKNQKCCSVACYHKSQIGIKRKPLTPELKQRLSQALKGKTFADMGRSNPSVETRHRMGQAASDRYKRMFGPDYVSTVDLITKVRTTLEYRRWRSHIYQRDNWTCQTCNERGNGNLEAHHIEALNQILKRKNITTLEQAFSDTVLWDITNGITLCTECHKLTDNYGRKILKHAA